MRKWIVALRCVNSHLQNVSDQEQEPRKHCILVPELRGHVFSEIWPKNFILNMMNEIGTFSLADKNLSEPISLSKQCYLVYNFEYIVKLGSWSNSNFIVKKDITLYGWLVNTLELYKSMSHWDFMFSQMLWSPRSYVCQILSSSSLRLGFSC